MYINIVAAVSKVYDIFGPAFLRQCGYVVFCNSHASDLKREIKILRDAVTRLRHEVDHADGVGDIVEDDVWGWLTEAEELINSKSLILEKNVVTCCFGIVPNPRKRYVLGRRAKKSLPELRALVERGKFDGVSYHPVAELVSELKVRSATSTSSSTVRYVDLKSRALVVKRIMADLNDHDRIGVYGMGGVGKTTLLRDVEKRARESGKFDDVVTVFVSQAPNIEGIKSKILNKLGSLRSTEANKKTLLVLLDDLWSKLKDVENLKKDNVKVKWVMTSRKQELLAKEMDCYPTISLGILEEDEVWSFFGKLVNNNKDEDMKNNPAVAALLKKCAGLPVSIEALANVLEKKGLSSIDLVNADVLKLGKESVDGSASLLLSYNYLGDSDVANLARSLFRIIGLLGTPTVPVLTLLKYTIGLGLLGGGSSSSSSSDGNIMERARRQVSSSLRMLQDASLLLESDDSDYVKIHDVVRDVAASIASRDDGALIFDSEDGLKGWSSRDDIPVLNEETGAAQGLGLLDPNSSNSNIMERATRHVISLRMLQDASLLLGSYDSNYVKIHDVVRDVAASIASRDNHALIFDREEDLRAGWSKEKLKKCRSVYLPNSVISKLNDKRKKKLDDKEWECPELRIFIMEGDQDLSRQQEGRGQVELQSSFSKGDQHVELPDALFKHTVKLRVLHFKNALFTSLPSSINSELQNLTTLCLDNCCLENIAAIGKLKTLQALSITGSDLAKLPEEIGELTKLKMLDLSKCSQLVFIEPGILKRLTQLEELYLKESFDKWGTEGDGGKMNASLEELNSMPRLRTLEVRIPDTSKLPRNLPIADLVQCKVIMGKTWNWSGEYTQSRTLKLEVESNSMINEQWFQSALQKTQDLDLHLEGLNNRTMESFHELCREGFEELKHLHLQNSSSIECIIWSTEWLECSAFTVLESMVLEKMGSLEKICNGRISLSSFSKLKVVRVQECHKLRSIFNLSLLKNLTELEEIEISDCDMVQQIVIGEQVDEETVEEQSCWGRGCSNINLFGGRPTKRRTTDAEEGATVVDNEIVMLLGNLRYLTLRNLPKITSFFTTEGGPSDQTMETSVAPTSTIDDVDGGGGDGDGATGGEQRSVGMNGAGASGGGDVATGKEQRSVGMNGAGASGAGAGGASDDGGGAIGEEQQSVGMNVAGAGAGAGGATGEEQQSVGMNGGGAGDDGGGATGEELQSVVMNGVGAGVGADGGGLTGEEQQSVGMNRCSNILFGRGEGVIRPQRQNVAAVFFNDQKVSKLPKYKEIQSTTCLRLDKLQRVELIYCKNVVHFTNSQVLLKLVNLESLTIEECESLEDIFDLEGIKPESGNVEILPKLYELKLRDLPKLAHIWKNNRRQIKGYRKLRTVEIYQCDSLRYFSGSFMCEVMENLTEINVGSCKEIETIFREEEGQESNASSVKVQLTSLKIFAVSECRKLKAFLSTNSRRNKGMAYWCYGKKAVDTSISFFNEKVFLPSLESLILSNAGDFEKIWCWEIPPGDESYCKLEYLHVWGCNSLPSIIPASMIERLHNLKQLWVMECRKLEVVFDIDVGLKIEKKSKDLMLTQLQEMKLKGLKSLTHVMKRGSDDDEIVVGFPSLSRLAVSLCEKLIHLIPTTTATTLIELTSLEIHSCPKLQEVISGEVSERYKRNVITLPHLTSLKLTSLASLTYFSSGSHRFDFTCLKVLKIESCGSLRALIKPRSDGGTGSQDEDQANSAAQVLFNEKIQLPNLEELHIAECKSLQDICKTTSTKQIECSRDSILVFTRLTFLELGSEIRLSHLWSGSYTLEIPFLKRLRFRGTNEESFQAIMEKVYLPNLEELVVSSADIEELWHNEPLAGSFSKLKRLEVEDCDQLRRIIPYRMVKNLQNLEMLVVKLCFKLETLCELIIDDVDDREGSKLAFSPFQNLASIHVEACGWLTSLFEITSRQFEETSDHKIMQLPQLAYLTLYHLPDLKHLFYLREGGQKYALELPSLKEFLLINVEDEEAVTHEVTFPEEFKIQNRASEDVSNFFGSMAGVVTDIVEALKTNQVIIRLFGYMDVELKQAVEKEAPNLFDQVVECRGGARNIQDGLREVLSISYGEAEVQRRAQRLRKTLLSYIRKRRLLLIISVDFADEEDIMMLEAAGIPRDGFDPKHFKIILVSKNKELLLKMGAHQQPIIPIGREVASRWKIFKPKMMEVVTTLWNDDEQIIGMYGRTSDTKGLLTDVVSLLQRYNSAYIFVEPDDNEVDTIQENLKTALGITSCETGLHECIRQNLLSNQNKQLILVLRDLHQEVDLEAVGIPPLDDDGFLDSKNFKIILTSENEEVLQKMCAQKTFEVKSAESIETDNPFISVQDGYAELRKLADECGSEILALGLALKLKDQGVDAWKNAFQRLKEAPFEYKERLKVIESLDED